MEITDRFLPDHPDAGKIQTLGILGLVFSLLFGIVGLVLNIICLSNSATALREINANPGKYTETSIGKIKTGRTCSIIGLSLQGFAILLLIIVLVIAS